MPALESGDGAGYAGVKEFAPTWQSWVGLTDLRESPEEANTRSGVPRTALSQSLVEKWTSKLGLPASVWRSMHRRFATMRSM